MTFSRGTRQLSRINSQVEDDRSPSLSSFFPTWKPGNSRSTRNAVTPLYPAAGLALANSRKKPASAALVIHSLRPLSRKWSPRSSARVAMAKASEPDPASESAYDATVFSASLGRYLAFCSALAHLRSALLQMVFWTSTITPAEGSTAESSSTEIG